MAKQRKQPKVFTPVTEDERKAISALQSVVFPVASPPKRFARDACGAERMTDAQRLLLWRIVHRFRRQIADKQLVRLAAERMQQPITESQPAQEQPAEPHWHRRANAGEPCPELVERLARTPNLK